MARDMIPETEAATGANSSPDEIRARWIAELRRQGHRQCTGSYTDFGGRVCALGLLAEVAGHSFERGDWPDDIGDLAGLREDHSDKIVGMNDGKWEFHKHTFAEIADVVEGWFKS